MDAGEENAFAGTFTSKICGGTFVNPLGPMEMNMPLRACRDAVTAAVNGGVPMLPLRGEPATLRRRASSPRSTAGFVLENPEVSMTVSEPNYADPQGRNMVFTEPLVLSVLSGPSALD